MVNPIFKGDAQVIQNKNNGNKNLNNSHNYHYEIEIYVGIVKRTHNDIQQRTHP